MPTRCPLIYRYPAILLNPLIIFAIFSCLPFHFAPLSSAQRAIFSGAFWVATYRLSHRKGLQIFTHTTFIQLFIRLFYATFHTTIMPLSIAPLYFRTLSASSFQAPYELSFPSTKIRSRSNLDFTNKSCLSRTLTRAQNPIHQPSFSSPPAICPIERESTTTTWWRTCSSESCFQFFFC